jgi:hypothetical protein
VSETTRGWRSGDIAAPHKTDPRDNTR